MSQDIASLVLRVDSLEARNATADIKRLAKEGQKTESVFKGFGKTMLSLGVGTGIGLFLGAIVKNTIEAEKATAQLEARLKSTGGVSGMTKQSLLDLASGLQAVTTYDDEAIQGSEALLLTFTKIGKDVFPQATEAALNMSTALGTDLNSATLQLGKALNDPIKGISALSRAGVQFSADQKAMIKEMVATNNIAGAQKLILGELEVQMGGAARAARDTLGGAIEGLTNQFGELLEGDSGGEGVKGATQSINDLASLMASPEVKSAFGQMIQGLAQLATFAVNAITAFAGLGQAIRDSLAADAQKSYLGLLKKRVDLEDDLSDLQKGGLNNLNLVLKGRSGEVQLLSGKAANIAHINDLLKKQTILEEQARKTMAAAAPKGVPTATGGVVDATGAAARAAAEKAAAAAAKAAAKGRDSLAKEQARALDSLRDSLATEEEAIQKSYAEREKIISESTNLSIEERDRLSARNASKRDEELAQLHEKDAAELESLRKSLRTQEEAIAESYAERMKIIENNTKGNDALATQLRERETARRDEELQAIADAEQSKRDQMYEGYMTEDELMRQHHERKKEEILRFTKETETERQELLRMEEERYMAESAERERQRLQMMRQSAGDMFGALSDLMKAYSQNGGKEAKKLFRISQALNLAQAVMGIASGISEAQKLPFPMNIMEGIRVAAVGAVQIAAIKNQQFAGNYDEGGYIPAGKWGNVGEKGVERVRGPAMVMGRLATERRQREEERKANRIVNKREGDVYKITVMPTPGTTRETIDQTMDVFAQKLQRVRRNNS